MSPRTEGRSSAARLPDASQRALRPFVAHLSLALATAAHSPEPMSVLHRYVQGVHTYLRARTAHHYRGTTCVFRAGSTRLLAVGNTDPEAEPVLLIPSMINRADIFDLSPENSLARFLLKAGLAPYILDWGKPRADEAEITLDAYLAHRLVSALSQIQRRHPKQPVHALGYCLGSLFALWLARAQSLGRLVLLAPPWDWSQSQHAPAIERLRILMTAHLAQQEQALDHAVMQMIFLIGGGRAVIDKFCRLNDLPPAQQNVFALVEDWLNRPTPLPKRVAQCVFGDWLDPQVLAQGQVEIAKIALAPEKIQVPALVVVAQHDQVVPPEVSLPLVDRLGAARVVTHHCGHIGLIASRDASKQYWQQWVTFLRQGG